MVDWSAPEAPFEPATDMLGGEPFDWRTPGINPKNDVNEGNADTRGLWERYKDFAEWGSKKRDPKEVVEGAKEKITEPVRKLFTRGSFVLIGIVFITIALVMISRPVQQGIVEGVKEGLTS